MVEMIIKPMAVKIDPWLDIGKPNIEHYILTASTLRNAELPKVKLSDPMELDEFIEKHNISDNANAVNLLKKICEFEAKQNFAKIYFLSNQYNDSRFVMIRCKKPEKGLEISEKVGLLYKYFENNSLIIESSATVVDDKAYSMRDFIKGEYLNDTKKKEYKSGLHKGFQSGLMMSVEHYQDKDNNTKVQVYNLGVRHPHGSICLGVLEPNDPSKAIIVGTEFPSNCLRENMLFESQDYNVPDTGLLVPENIVLHPMYNHLIRMTILLRTPGNIKSLKTQLLDQFSDNKLLFITTFAGVEGSEKLLSIYREKPTKDNRENFLNFQPSNDTIEEIRESMKRPEYWEYNIETEVFQCRLRNVKNGNIELESDANNSQYIINLNPNPNPNLIGEVNNFDISNEDNPN